MIFRKQKQELQEKEDERYISNLNAITEHALNSRLDGLRFKVLNKSEFEEQKLTEPHSINQISFVRVYDNGVFSHFELYKGDILILPKALPPSPEYRLGKVVRVNATKDSVGRYFFNQRYGLNGYLPQGESLIGTAIGFTSDSGAGNFLHTTEDGRIQLGTCNPAANAMLEGCSKLTVKITHGNTTETISYELMMMNLPPARTGTSIIGESLPESALIKVNNTYYIGVKDGYEYWAGNIMGTGTYGLIPGRFKDTTNGYNSYKRRCGLYLSMPNIHGHNLASGTKQFEVRLGIWCADYTSSGSISYRTSYVLDESSSLYHRLGLRYSLIDGSDQGVPTFEECFVPGKTNYEDFLDIARIICVPYVDTNGNEVRIYDS